MNNKKCCKFCGHNEFYRKFKISGSGRRNYTFDDTDKSKTSGAENGSMLDCIPFALFSVARCGMCDKIVGKYKKITFPYGMPPLNENIEVRND